MSNNNYTFDYELEKVKRTENGERIKVVIKLPDTAGWYDDVKIVIKKGNDNLIHKLHHKRNSDGLVYFEGEFDLDTRAIYHYYFEFFVNGTKMFGKNNNTFDNKNVNLDEMNKLSVNFSVPDWVKGKVMYHIFVDRFNRGSKESMQEMPRRTCYKSFDDEIKIGPDEKGVWNADFYGGDLKGIEEKLNYIYSLGARIIYLSPIVYSQSNHRYDTADYVNVDPYVGCNEDLKSLCDAAHRRGMKVILDAVFNHTGNDSKYFNEYGTFDTVGAFHSKDSPYFDFYRKHYDGDKVNFDYWWRMTNLPVCDSNSSAWQEYITGENGVIDQWFDLGIDGLRLDVADELSDDIIEKIRIAVKRNKKDGFILGEVWKNPMRMGRGYVESGKGMDSVMNYPLVDALIRYFKYQDVDKLARIIKEIKAEYPEDTINSLMNFTSTHDISRAITIFALDLFQKNGEWSWDPVSRDLDWSKNTKLDSSQYKHGRDVYEAYVFALNFMPGVLSIFYGDEVGIEGMGNLANRKSFSWNHIDKKLLEFFKEMGAIRNNEQFLETADFNILDINSDYFVFERVNENDRMLVVVNRSDKSINFCFPDEYSKNVEKVYTLKKSNPGHLEPYGAVAVKKGDK